MTDRMDEHLFFGNLFRKEKDFAFKLIGTNELKV